MFNEPEIIIEEEKQEQKKRIVEPSFCGGFCSAFSFNNMITFYCPLMVKKDIYHPTNVYCKDTNIQPENFIEMINK